MAQFQLRLPEGRIVKGHPLKLNDQMSDGQPVKNPDGTIKKEIYVAIAIPKTQTDWKSEVWGQTFIVAATDPENGYPNGETNRPNFSWKVQDGDTTIPNNNGTVLSDLEGHKGHWIVNITSRLPSHILGGGIPSWPENQYNDDDKFTLLDDQTGRVNRLKTGDFGIFILMLQGNKTNGKAAQTPGLYMNPQAFAKTRDGVEIVGEGGSISSSTAASLFGGSTPAQAPTAPPVQPVTPPSAPAPTMPPPAHDLVSPPTAPPPAPVAEAMWTYNGQTLPESQWLTNGWTIETLQAHATKG